MVASTGDPLLSESAIESYQEKLFPRAALVTPNRDEAAILWGQEITTHDHLHQAALELTKRYQVPFLVKGGHLGGRYAVDLLALEGQCKPFSEPMVPGVHPHGTGCTFSAAICAGLASGMSMIQSIDHAKAFITRAIREHHEIGDYQLLNQLPST